MSLIAVKNYDITNTEPKSDIKTVIFCHIRKAGGSTIGNAINALHIYSLDNKGESYKFLIDSANLNMNLENEEERDIFLSNFLPQNPGILYESIAESKVTHVIQIEEFGCPTGCMHIDRNSTAWIFSIRDPVERQISEFWYSGPGRVNYTDIKRKTLTDTERTEKINDYFQQWINGTWNNCGSGIGTIGIYDRGCYVEDYMIRFLLGKQNYKCTKINWINLAGHSFYIGELNEELYDEAITIVRNLDVVIILGEYFNEGFNLLQRKFIEWGFENVEEAHASFQQKVKNQNTQTTEFRDIKMEQKIFENLNIWDKRLYAQIVDDHKNGYWSYSEDE